jgi:hypothetical protein
MSYALVRVKQYWALVQKEGKTLAICHRGAAGKWFVFLEAAEGPQWIGERRPTDFPSVEDAFWAFINFNENGG